MAVGSGVAVDWDVAVGSGVAVDWDVAVGSGVAVGLGVAVDWDVAVGSGLAAGSGVDTRVVASGSAHAATDAMSKIARAASHRTPQIINYSPRKAT